MLHTKNLADQKSELISEQETNLTAEEQLEISAAVEEIMNIKAPYNKAAGMTRYFDKYSKNPNMYSAFADALKQKMNEQ